MRCSVVFGITLRLLDINISSSPPAINTAAYYRRCVITSEMVAVVHRRLCLQHLPVAALTQAVRPDVSLESLFLPTPHAFDAPIRGVPVGILLCRLARNNKNGVAARQWKFFDDMFIHFDSTYKRDRQTHTHTDTTTWRHRPRLCTVNSIAISAYPTCIRRPPRGKN